MKKYTYFTADEIKVVTDAVAMAEELVSNHYKLSATQLLHLNYDVKTLADLTENEIVDRHFAQIVRYAEKRKHDFQDLPVNDFYKICLQDHSILRTLKECRRLHLHAFAVYIVCHELIHIVRFRKFLQHFDAPLKEKLAEEKRVHIKTHEILSRVPIDHMAPVLDFYKDWRQPPHDISPDANPV